MAIQYLIPLIGLVDDLYNLSKIINRSPVKKNEGVLTTTRNETTNQLDKTIDLSKQDIYLDTLGNVVSGKKQDSTVRTLDNVSTIQTVTENNTASLISVIGSKNKIMQEQNALLRKQVEHMELANELRSASIYANYENTVALMGALEVVGRELMLTRELTELHANYATANNYLQYEKANLELNGSETLVNSSGEKIKPLEEKAKYHSEKRIDEERMNKFEWAKLMDGLTEVANEISDEALTLFDDLANVYKLDNDSIKLIDDEVKKINWS